MLIQGEDNPTGPPQAFLSALGDRLSSMNGVDASLADILKTHLLKADAAQDAVAQAMAAISRLAKERAAPPKPRDANG
jgi:hypothetical protein